MRLFLIICGLIVIASGLFFINLLTALLNQLLTLTGGLPAGYWLGFVLLYGVAGWVCFIGAGAIYDQFGPHPPKGWRTKYRTK